MHAYDAANWATELCDSNGKKPAEAAGSDWIPAMKP